MDQIFSFNKIFSFKFSIEDTDWYQIKDLVPDIPKSVRQLQLKPVNSDIAFLVRTAPNQEVKINAGEMLDTGFLPNCSNVQALEIKTAGTYDGFYML